MRESLLMKIANFFLYLHRLAVLLVVLAPLIFFFIALSTFHCYSCYYEVYILDILLFLLYSIGPIALSFYTAFYFFLFAFEMITRMQYLLVIPIILILIIVKAALYYLVKGSRIDIWDVPKLLIATSLFIILFSIILSVLMYGIRNLACHLSTMVLFLVLTIGVDVTVFSYIKYRDALNNTASPLWLVVLPVLWSISPLPYTIIYTRTSLWCILLILLTVIAAIQIIPHIILYKRTKKKTLSITKTQTNHINKAI